MPIVMGLDEADPAAGFAELVVAAELQAATAVTAVTASTVVTARAEDLNLRGRPCLFMVNCLLAWCGLLVMCAALAGALSGGVAGAVSG
jgi:hypothetical protein